MSFRGKEKMTITWLPKGQSSPCFNPQVSTHAALNVNLTIEELLLKQLMQNL